MGFKKAFSEVMREFAAAYPDEVDQLTAEQLAERTGYSLSIVRDYLRRQEDERRNLLRSEEEQHIREQEVGVVTYITSSGLATVLYYPLLGEIKIISRHRRKRVYSKEAWSGDLPSRPSLLLAPQDGIEIGIYLLGLQPHIRDVLARFGQQNAPMVAIQDGQDKSEVES
jgi:hypothetical protein